MSKVSEYMTEYVDYGSRTIFFKLFLSSRKTIEISVHPDLTVAVKAPLSADIVEIKRRVKKKSRWILMQKNYFEQFSPSTPTRAYVSGESHLFLGRLYRLRLKTGEKNSVKLKNGYFEIEYSGEYESTKIKELLEKWYSEKAKIHFNDSLERCFSKFSNEAIEKPKIAIRKMKRRWGSSTSKKTISLNPHLIKAPKECIDYVIIHELCHLIYNCHNSHFYMLLSKKMPDWKSVKQKLELKLS